MHLKVRSPHIWNWKVAVGSLAVLQILGGFLGFILTGPLTELAPTTPYPLWITPDEKLAVADVMALMRDHYEGTDYDMTRGIDAGPFGTPNRWRPMTWEVDGRKYSWERPISTQQTGFSFVSQSRSWLPDAIGGVYWYGLDDTYTSVEGAVIKEAR